MQKLVLKSDQFLESKKAARKLIASDIKSQTAFSDKMYSITFNTGKTFYAGDVGHVKQKAKEYSDRYDDFLDFAKIHGLIID